MQQGIRHWYEFQLGHPFPLIFISHWNVFNYLLVITYLFRCTKYNSTPGRPKCKNRSEIYKKKLPYVLQLIRTNSWHVTRIYAFILNCIRNVSSYGFYRCFLQNETKTFLRRICLVLFIQCLNRWNFFFFCCRHISIRFTVYWLKLQPCSTSFFLYQHSANTHSVDMENKPLKNRFVLNCPFFLLVTKQKWGKNSWLTIIEISKNVSTTKYHAK